MDEKIIKYCQGSLPKEEQKLLLKEAYNNPDLKSQIIDYQQLHSLLGLASLQADQKKGREAYNLFQKRISSQKRKLQIGLFIRYAAILIVTFITGWSISYFQFSKRQLLVSQQELIVPAGQRAELILPDGTKVWLNAGSKLTYPSFFEKERKVELTGEGFFQVAKNEEIPFIVSTKNINIKALGTQFNVYSYPKNDYTSVFLKEGKVKAYFPSSEKEGIILSPNQYLIQKGDKFTFSTMDQDELLWRDGIYSFKRQTFGEIIEKLELYYDVDIVVKDPEILNFEYVGKFRQKDGVMEILTLIQKIHRFKIKKDNDLNQIILSK